MMSYDEIVPMRDETRGTPADVRSIGEKQIRQIQIHPAMNGYIVYVGCRTIVFESAASLLSELKAYLNNPRDVEERYLRNE